MKGLHTIQVLWRQPDTMALWGIPHEMRPGQSPRDLWESTRTKDVAKDAAGWHGATTPAPGPRFGWIWLGTPGWWGHISRDDRARIEIFLDDLRDGCLVPMGPGEWTTLTGHVPVTRSSEPIVSDVALTLNRGNEDGPVEMVVLKSRVSRVP